MPLHGSPNPDLIEIGTALVSSEKAQRLRIPIVGTHAVSGPALTVSGLLFLGTGSWIGLGWFDIGIDRIQVPIGFLILLGWGLAAFGLALMVGGIRQLWARRRIHDLQTRFPDQAWAWDGHWMGRTILDHNPRSLGRHMLRLPFLIFLVAIFHYVGFVDDRTPDLFRYTSFFLDLVLLVSVGLVAHSLMRLTRHGRGRIELQEMPIRPGQSCRMRFTLGSELSFFDTLHLQLAYVEERVVQTGTRQDRSRHIIAETFLMERSELDLAQRANNNMQDLELILRIPSDGPVTQIFAEPSRSWQLGIHLCTMGLDYKGRFLLPVYGSSAAAPEKLTARRTSSDLAPTP